MPIVVTPRRLDDHCAGNCLPLGQSPIWQRNLLYRFKHSTCRRNIGATGGCFSTYPKLLRHWGSKRLRRRKRVSRLCKTPTPPFCGGGGRLGGKFSCLYNVTTPPFGGTTRGGTFGGGIFRLCNSNTPPPSVIIMYALHHIN